MTNPPDLDTQGHTHEQRTIRRNPEKLFVNTRDQTPARTGTKAPINLPRLGG